MKPEERIKAIQAVKNFTTRKKELINEYRGGYLGIKKFQVTLENGNTLPCEQVTKNGGDGEAVVIVPITEEGNYIVVVQARPNTKETVAIEFPAGMVNENEDPKDAAFRELVEETGYVPERMYYLEHHYQDQGCHGPKLITTYVAEGCRKLQRQELDPEENLTYIEVDDQDIREFLQGKKGDILTEIGMRDANSKIGYMTLKLEKNNLL